MPLDAGTAFVDLVPRVSKTFAAQANAAIAPALRKVGKQVSAQGAALSRSITLPIVAGFAGAVFVSDKLAKGLREVVTLTGETGAAADAAFAEFKEGVAGVSAELGLAQSTLTDGLYQALSAGVPRANVFEFLETAGQAAVGGVTDVETAVDGLTTIINAFGLEAEDAEAVADSMFTTVKGGKTTFEELSASLFQVAPTAAGLGVEFTEVNAALAAMTAQGIPTSEATNRIRAAMDALLKRGDQLAPIFNELGYESAEAAIRQEGLQFALNAVNDSAGGSSEALIGLLGRTEAMQAVQVLAGSGAEKYTAELLAQGDAAGATAAAFTEVDKARSFDRLKTSLTNIGIQIGDVLLPLLTELVEDYIQPAADAFGELDEKTKRIIVGVGALAAAVGPVLFVGGKLIALLGLVAAHPVIAAILALAAGAVLLYQNFEPFRDLVDGIVDSLAPLAEGIQEVVGQIAGGDLSALTDGLEDVKAGAQDLLGNLGLDEEVEKLQDAGGLIGGYFSEEVWPALIDGLDALREPISDFADFFIERWEPIQEAVRNIIGVIVRLVELNVATILHLWDAFGDDLLGIVETVWDTIVGVVKGAVQIISGIFDVVLGILTLDWDRVWGGLQGVVSGAWDAIYAIIDGALSLIVDLLGVAWETITELWERLWAVVKASVRGAWDFIYGIVAGSITDLIALVTALPRLLLDALGGMWEFIHEQAKSAIDTAVGFVTALPGRITGLVGSVVAAASSIGSAILDGLISGISGVISGAADIGRALYNGVARFLNTHLINKINRAVEFEIGLPFGQKFGVNPPDIPNLPILHDGGIVPGRRGEEVVALLQAGETVIPAGQALGAPAPLTSFNIYDAPNARAVAEEVDALLGWRQTTRGDR